MKGVGLLVGTIFLILICAIVYSNCTGNCRGFSTEGFQIKGPEPTKLVEPVPRKELTDLPTAPYTNMADIPLPDHDPAEAKTLFQQLIALKADMDGFQERVYHYMSNRSDPNIQLPLMRFKGDYQRVKDELLVLAANPGLGVQLTEKELETIRANLRFLQRTYRTLEVNQLVPTNTVSEGFTSADDTTPISLDELKILSTKIAVEITRLRASGTSDPIVQSRINIFTKIQQSVNDILQKINDKRLSEKMIPIKKRDYNAFLPALGNNSAGIGGLLSSAGMGSLSSLFNSYDIGDISGSTLAGNLLDRYAETILNGLSYNVTLNYTSPNELAKELAKAAQVEGESRGEFEFLIATYEEGENEMNGMNGMNRGNRGGGHRDGGHRDGGHRGHRGHRDSVGHDGNPMNDEDDISEKKGEAGMFNWKERSQGICKAISAFGLDPSDFGCLAPGTQVSPDYSWRGNARMVCSRAQAIADPGIPEQIGCPPFSWKGWRN